MKFSRIFPGHGTYLIRKSMIDLVRKTYFGNAAGCDLAKISKKLKMTIFDRFFLFYRLISIDDQQNRPDVVRLTYKKSSTEKIIGILATTSE